MKNWKAVVAGMLALCLLVMLPISLVYAEEGAEQETEEPIPESYYAPIQSNEVDGWPQGPAIESAAAVVMDLDTGAFLYSKSATEKMYPASTTKIMTALLLIENSDLDDEITFSEIVYDLEEGSSHLGIQPGEKMILRDALYGIMLASANDISNGVAEYIGGSLSGFADMMNARAAEIGCVNTHFSNPHGLYSEDHYTCAYDMALIAQEAYKNPIFREVAGTRMYAIPETNLTEEERSFLNHHKMLQPDEEYYREWCTGGKNGFTSECLNTLVTFAEQDEKRLVSVVFRVNGAGKAYEDTTAIMEYALQNFHNTNSQKKTFRRSFYDIMGFGYLGRASEFQSPVWMRSPVGQRSVRLTLPNGAALDQLSIKTQETDGNYRAVSYEYNGYPVGNAYGIFYPIYAPAEMIYERAVDVQVQAQDSSGGNLQIESMDEVLTQAVAIFDNGYRMFRDYTENHTMTVIAGGIVLLIVLIVFIIILVFRCTSDSRIRRRRAIEEKERKKREEEIERMTTAEIEAELRAVMAQERMRQEQQAMAEAERAASEGGESEEESYETEQP